MVIPNGDRLFARVAAPAALLVHRVTLRNAQALSLAAMAGVAGYFAGGLIMTGILGVLVIILATSGL
jgi:hypothetical protein